LSLTNNTRRAIFTISSGIKNLAPCRRAKLLLVFSIYIEEMFIILDICKNE